MELDEVDVMRVLGRVPHISNAPLLQIRKRFYTLSPQVTAARSVAAGFVHQRDHLRVRNVQAYCVARVRTEYGNGDAARCALCVRHCDAFAPPCRARDFNLQRSKTGQETQCVKPHCCTERSRGDLRHQRWCCPGGTNMRPELFQKRVIQCTLSQPRRDFCEACRVYLADLWSQDGMATKYADVVCDFIAFAVDAPPRQRAVLLY